MKNGPSRAGGRRVRNVLSTLLVGGLLAPVAAADGFSPQRMVAAPGMAASVGKADLDGDGDLDVVCAGGEEVAWYENRDGRGTFGRRRMVSASGKDLLSIDVADFDGDGDVDVVAAGDDRVTWYENRDGLGTFGPHRVITTLLASAHSVFAADLDGDGDPDVLSASYVDGTVAWYENLDGKGSFGPQRPIAGAQYASSVYASDIDLDGDLDVLSAYYTGIDWYENLDGAGTFSTPRAIATNLSGGRSVFTADVDGDGDPDALMASFGDDMIAWYENRNGAGNFGPQQIITTQANGAESVYAADLDGDGDLDVLSSSDDDWNPMHAWYENLNGAGAFGPQQLIYWYSGGDRPAVVGDMDGDGDPDVLAGLGHIGQIAWFENTNGAAAFGPPRYIASLAEGAWSVFAADIDGDGNPDILSASIYDDQIAWYPNEGGLGIFEEQHVITTVADQAESVYAADIDGDGDQDALSASWLDDDVAWYENVDGAGTFGPQRIITHLADGPTCVRAADIDGDGDQDVLTASENDGMIAWYDNTDGLGTFGSPIAITVIAYGARAVHAVDVDADGDIDVLAAAVDKITWYENIGGLSMFGPELVITSLVTNGSSVFAADLDGDGDPDALSASRGDNKVAWYENRDGAGDFGPQRVITSLASGARGVHAADLDGDGDQDVLSASSYDDRVAWYDNLDGAGTFGAQSDISRQAHGAVAVFAADLDGDGDQDVLSASHEDHKVAWYANDPAYATFRTDAAGVNPTAFTATTAILGRDWITTVDNEVTGNLAAWIVGFANPLEVFLPAVGEYLLVDTASAGGELLGLSPAVGYYTVGFVVAVPQDPVLLGITLSTQAVGFGGPAGINLHNAFDLRLGY